MHECICRFLKRLLLRQHMGVGYTECTGFLLYGKNLSVMGRSLSKKEKRSLYNPY